LALAAVVVPAVEARSARLTAERERRYYRRRHFSVGLSPKWMSFQEGY